MIPAELGLDAATAGAKTAAMKITRDLLLLAITIACATAPAAPAWGALAPWTAAERATFWDSPQDAAPKELLGINDEFKGRSYTTGDEFHLELFAPKVRNLGGGYMGVGSDQAYIFIGWARPEVAWLTDYDPLVVALHAAYRVFFLHSADGAAFLQRWNSKNAAESLALLKQQLPPTVSKSTLAAFRLSRSLIWARLNRVRHMLNKAKQPCFLDEAAAYAHIQQLYQLERIRPLSANLLESKAIVGIGAAARTLGVHIHGLYLSNAEEYWPYSPQFRKNIQSLPFGDAAIVWRTLSGFKKNGDYCYHIQTAASYLGYLQRKVWKVFAIMRCGDKTPEQAAQLLYTDRVPPELKPKAPAIQRSN
ncbi:MAG: hypothetical protein EXR77_00955 [Myxococcales bacterium]|nr:hypothetical protein [Myxococcales bacterium]